MNLGCNMKLRDGFCIYPGERDITSRLPRGQHDAGVYSRREPTV
jgi:hypothetical protein